jgi:hypothetical protein
MDEESRTAVAVPIIMERRRQRTVQWSSSEVMRILRKRAAKAATRKADEAITVK